MEERAYKFGKSTKTVSYDIYMGLLNILKRWNYNLVPSLPSSWDVWPIVDWSFETNPAHLRTVVGLMTLVTFPLFSILSRLPVAS